MALIMSKTATSLLNTLIRVSSTQCSAIIGNLTSRHYAVVAKKSKASAGGRVKEFPVETDPHRLVNYCCGSNYFIEGEDVKLKPESEYPDWLWTIRTGPPPQIHELDPNSKEYWEAVRKLAIKRQNAKTHLQKKVLRRF